MTELNTGNNPQNSKKTWWILALGTLPLFLLLVSCGLVNNNDEAIDPIPADMFEVHLLAHFDNTPVQIQIDGEEVFDSTATTNYILSLAEIIKLDILQGVHTISTTIEGFQKDSTFTVADTLVVMIMYNAGDIPGIQYFYAEPPNLPQYQ